MVSPANTLGSIQQKVKSKNLNVSYDLRCNDGGLLLLVIVSHLSVLAPSALTMTFLAEFFWPLAHFFVILVHFEHFVKSKGSLKFYEKKNISYCLLMGQSTCLTSLRLVSGEVMHVCILLEHMLFKFFDFSSVCLHSFTFLVL